MPIRTPAKELLNAIAIEVNALLKDVESIDAHVSELAELRKVHAMLEDLRRFRAVGGPIEPRRRVIP